MSNAQNGPASLVEMSQEKHNELISDPRIRMITPFDKREDSEYIQFVKEDFWVAIDIVQIQEIFYLKVDAYDRTVSIPIGLTGLDPDGSLFVNAIYFRENIEWMFEQLIEKVWLREIEGDEDEH